MVGAGAPVGQGSGRWRQTKRRGGSASRPACSPRHAQILANDTLETQVQNDMSPFPPTYRGQVSRRHVPEHIRARYMHEYKLPTLPALCLEVAAAHFSTHILPTPEVLEALTGPSKARPKRARRDKDEYVPDDEDIPQAKEAPALPRLSPDDARAWHDRNKVWLQHLPAQYMDKLYERMCEHSPLSITKEVLSCYILPQVGSAPGSSRLRERIFFPASLPLFSQDTKCAALLLATLAGSLALSPHAAEVVGALRAVDLHGLTRLPAGAVVRLLKAPRMPWHLARVTLPGCLAVDDATIEALIAATGASLTHLDVTMTSVSPMAISVLGRGAPRLERLHLAWCDGFVDERVAEAISTCIAQGMAARPPVIPFRHLSTLDVSHTSMGDVALGSVCGLVGPQLASLDVSYTQVGEAGTLEVLAMGLRSASAGPSRLEHLGLAGLCVHASALVRFLRAFLPGHGESRRSALRSLRLDDLVEYSRRDPTSLQGRCGLSGDTLHGVAEMVHAASMAGHHWERVSVGGDKRPASAPSHWALPGQSHYTLGDTLALLMNSVVRLHVGGLEMPASHLAPLHEHTPLPDPAQRRLRAWHAPATALRDDALLALLPWTGALESVSLDDTLITPTSIDALVAANPALAWISLSQCRGVPVRQRRRVWAPSP
ncbi:hypothetical protein MCAP1_002450 [Malassezia caprae]|uniref:Uncharacterized protein n=1 Tax=Malassezia caprae TaxID=1381934 RepID=A0AAF0ECC7_9BASI|nr:hypothetical protein MCAP1_002450 [Malassezia caprae]